MQWKRTGIFLLPHQEASPVCIQIHDISRVHRFHLFGKSEVNTHTNTAHLTRGCQFAKQQWSSSTLRTLWASAAWWGASSNAFYQWLPFAVDLNASLCLLNYCSPLHALFYFLLLFIAFTFETLAPRLARHGKPLAHVLRLKDDAATQQVNQLSRSLAQVTRQCVQSVKKFVAFVSDKKKQIKWNETSFSSKHMSELECANFVPIKINQPVVKWTEVFRDSWRWTVSLVFFFFFSGSRVKWVTFYCEVLFYLWGGKKYTLLLVGC